ncbi:hypothetical protein CHUAL_004396 [Chamberlinius hualienensis]
MLDDVSVYGTFAVVFLCLIFFWFLSSTLTIVVLLIVIAVYVKTRWFGDNHVANDQSPLQLSQHEARQRLNKDGKKYGWESYDSFNEHWRQRLMSFTVPSSSPNVPKRMVNAQPTYRKPEQSKRRNNSHSPPNKLSSHTRKRVSESPKTGWISPLKSYNYGPGLYPKVNLADMQPLQRSSNGSNLTKSRVTVKLSTNQFSPPSSSFRQIEMEIPTEKKVAGNMHKSTRKRHMKTSLVEESDQHKKQRINRRGVETLVQESVLPDHFIENPNTVTEALKLLEKVQKVLGTPKTNAIESSYSSMKRYRTKPLIRERIEIEDDEESPKAKIMRCETKILPKSAFQHNNDVIMQDLSPARVEEEKTKIAEEETEMPEENSEKQLPSENLNQQLFVPNLNDHLNDKKKDYDRLQRILKQFSSNSTEEAVNNAKGSDQIESVLFTPSKVATKIVPPTPETTTNFGSIKTNSPTITSALSSPLSAVTTSSVVSFSSAVFNPASSGLNTTSSSFSPTVSGPNTPNSGFNSTIAASNFGSSGFNLTNSGLNLQNAASGSTPSSGLNLLSPQINLSPTSASISFLTTTTSTTLSPIHCNGVTGNTRVNTVSDTTSSFTNATPVKAVSAFQFGASEHPKSQVSGLFTFGTSNVTNGTSNGFNFGANTQPSVNFGSPMGGGGGEGMFSIGSGSTAPRIRTGLRNRR